MSICIFVRPWSIEASSLEMFLICCSACLRSVRMWLQHLCFYSYRDLMMREKYSLISQSCSPQNYQDYISFYFMTYLVPAIEVLISFTSWMNPQISTSLGLREQLPLREREWLFLIPLEFDWVGDVNKLTPLCCIFVIECPWLAKEMAHFSQKQSFYESILVKKAATLLLWFWQWFQRKDCWDGEGCILSLLMGDLPEDLLKSAAGVLILTEWSCSRLVWSQFYMPNQRIQQLLLPINQPTFQPHQNHHSHQGVIHDVVQQNKAFY